MSTRTAKHAAPADEEFGRPDSSKLAATLLRRISMAGGLVAIAAFLATTAINGGAERITGAADWNMLAILLPLLLLPVALTLRPPQAAAPLQYLFIALFVLGAAGASELRRAHGLSSWPSEEWLLLGTVYVYFVTGLPLWRALLCGLGASAALIAVHIHAGRIAGLRDDVFYLLVANAAGAGGLFLLERQAGTRLEAMARLRRGAQHDELTGLFSHKALDDHIVRLWRQAQRERKGLGLVKVDVDHLADLNYRYGRNTGNACLKHVADALASFARRPLDAAGRIEGGEFLLASYDPAPDWLSSVVRSLPGEVARLQLSAEVGAPALSISGGAVLVHPRAGDSLAECLAETDVQLQRARESGRNQVCLRQMGLNR